MDKQKAELEQKCAELQALRKAGEGAEAGLRSEMSRLRDQSQSDKAELEKAKEVRHCVDKEYHLIGI